MDWAQSNLNDYVRMKRIAGLNFRAVKAILRDVGLALQHMHRAGWIHGTQTRLLNTAK